MDLVDSRRRLARQLLEVADFEVAHADVPGLAEAGPLSWQELP